MIAAVLSVSDLGFWIDGHHTEISVGRERMADGPCDAVVLLTSPIAFLQHGYKRDGSFGAHVPC